MLLLRPLLSHTALLCDHILWRLVASVSLYDYSDLLLAVSFCQHGFCLVFFLTYSCLGCF